MKNTRHFLLCALVIPMLSFSQTSDLGNWLLYFGNKQINDSWNWHNEVQYRSYNAFSDVEQLVIRTGAGYNLTPGNNNLLIGYAYILSENYLEGLDKKVRVNEHRVFEQFITRQSIGRVSVQHRYRCEQRFIESDFRLRFRYFLSLNIPLNRKAMSDGALYVSAYNEIFINASSSPFDRDRVYAGLGYQVSRSVRFELGYMNQILTQFRRDQINVISFITF